MGQIDTMDNKTGTNIKYGITQIPDVCKPIERIDKYWGYMDTLFDFENCTVKRIFMRKGCQSSLEFHCIKREVYYVESGILKIGLRVGRAENKSVTLSEGEIFHIEPGLMHMRIAVTDCIIVEISTKDNNSDSHIVEDGTKYIHKEV